MSRIKNKRMWWIGLAVIAAMLVAIPTALAQGPVVEPAGTNAPAWHSGAGRPTTATDTTWNSGSSPRIAALPATPAESPPGG